MDKKNTDTNKKLGAVNEEELFELTNEAQGPVGAGALDRTQFLTPTVQLCMPVFPTTLISCSLLIAK